VVWPFSAAAMSVAILCIWTNTGSDSTLACTQKIFSLPEGSSVSPSPTSSSLSFSRAAAR
jgi:hypothetical protein